MDLAREISRIISEASFRQKDLHELGLFLFMDVKLKED